MHQWRKSEEERVMGRVQGKVAFITGAARGQGRAHAVRLAEEGADIIGVDICEQIASVPYPMSTGDDLKETARLVEALGRRIVTMAADVRHQGSLDDAVAAGLAAFGRIDIVVANAGIVSYSPAAEMTHQLWNDMIDVQLTGAWQTVHAVIPTMIERGNGGSIVITSSGAGLHAFPSLMHYSAAKHGQVGLMKTLAVELGPHRIRVNTVHPGAVDTPMCQNEFTWKRFFPDVENPTREQFAEALLQGSALPTPWVESIDIANAVLFLASDEARFVTGVALPVDAGESVK